jgi:hypothetical protein
MQDMPRATPNAVPRDERIDFIRGWVMVILIVVHTEFFSLWNLVVWERFGVISGGEGFVLLSGLVLGMVSRNRLERDGWRSASSRLIDRAFQLYRVHIALIAIIFVLSLVAGTHVHEIVSFTDRGSGTTYPMYPDGQSLMERAASIATLKCGPHQVQVLALYVFLMLAAPVMIALLAARRTRALLVLSWVVYLWNIAAPKMITGAQFEYAFPLLTWQVLFVHGLTVGFHWNKIQAWFRTGAGRAAIYGCVAVAAAFLVFAQGTTNPLLPSWARFHLFDAFYTKHWVAYCQKNTLGILRLVNYGAFLVAIYALLTRCWGFFSRALGWFLIPIGQATLYVFILHVFVVAIASNLVPFGFGAQSTASLLANTALHTGELALLYVMVRHRVLFRWIPR